MQTINFSEENTIMPSKLIQSLIFCSLVALAVVTLSGTHAAGHGNNDATIGLPGETAQVNRTVNIEMNDAMRFIPSDLTVRQGETIRFLVKNSGIKKHEFVLGTKQELKAHYKLMKKFPEMEHADANMVTVAPEQTGEVIWHFTKAGEVHFACLIPGHSDAGMKGKIRVSAKKIPGQSLKGDSHVDHNH